MDYILALGTMFVVFVVPLIILVAVVGKPIARARTRPSGAAGEDGTRQALSDGGVH